MPRKVRVQYHRPLGGSTIGELRMIKVVCDSFLQATKLVSILPKMCWGFIVMPTGRKIKFGVEER